MKTNKCNDLCKADIFSLSIDLQYLMFHHMLSPHRAEKRRPTFG